MAFFVKGDAIANARFYSLCKVESDGSYTEVARKICDGNLAVRKGYYTTADGSLVENSNAACSDLIPLSALPTAVGVAEISGFVTQDGMASVCFFDITGLISVGTLSVSDIMDAGYLVNQAPDGAEYVVFSTYGENAEILFSWFDDYKGIYFALNDYTDVLTAGNTYHLVVKAIGEGGEDLNGDGVIYADSEYGGDASGEPLAYTPKVTDNGVWLSELLTGDSNAHDGFMAVANHAESLSSSAEYIYYTEDIKTLLEGKKITRVACPNLGAGNTVTFYSNPWSTSTLTKEGRSELFTITGGSGESTGGSEMTTYYVSNPVAVKDGESVAFAVSNGVKMVAYDQLSYTTPVKYAYNQDTYNSALAGFVNFDLYLED